ncbi:MAG: hypothetical protein K2P63_14075 [Lachnospiraceae bacterium]|nr:hypothetical protein [Lachnospiraceae bacterium]
MKIIKKILTIVTGSVLALSMTVTALAASPKSSENGFIAEMTLSEVVTYIEEGDGFVDDSFLNICESIIALKEKGFSESEILNAIEAKPMPASLYDKWGSLTDSEKALVVLYPTQALVIQSNAIKAMNSANSVYGHNGNGDVSDAYRHGYWNALNARDVGSGISEKFATAHEDISDEEMNTLYNGFYGWQHRSMDLHNNKVGREVVSWSDISTYDIVLSERIKEQIKKGNMVILVK